MTTVRPQAPFTRARRGSAIIEFALVFLLLITMVVGMFEFVWVLYIRASIHNAVREAVRYAITGDAGVLGLDGEIKRVIQEQSAGILQASEIDEYISVEFFDPNCPNGATCPAGGALSAGAAAAESGSIIKITINCYEVMPITSMFRRNPTTGAPMPFSVTVSASDKMEPFPGAPPSRGSVSSPTACP